MLFLLTGSIQYLAFELVECGILTGKLDETSLQSAIDRVLNNQDDYFQSLWESVSLTQQKTLKALAFENKNIFSREFLDKHGIQTPSGVQRSVAVLMHKGIIDRQHGEFLFEDPFFRRWIRLKAAYF